ncbi:MULTISPECIES: rhodanese-like domain-containing protein [unclassified Flavobacterium]|jgi:phage shock protein E|uniref:rhodanese-like domain-containing protein n=1 Tax=unclassified Flavobacterium TaxID=196869 RepID=UPI00131D149F|nr:MULTISPECIES: rhodanese-like domain-containing protein [unclassified Flavobacterium]
MLHILQNIFSKKDNGILEKMIQEGALLIDVRSQNEFSQGNVVGSVNIPLDQIENNLYHFRSKTNIIVYCRSGNRSGKAKSLLNKNGINNVTNGGTWVTIQDILRKITEKK